MSGAAQKVVDLDLFSSLFGIRICLCGVCDRLRTEFKGYSQSGPKWTCLLSHLENEHLCPFLSRVHHAVKGSLCRWNICYKCLQEGVVNQRPSVKPITQLIDVDLFDVHHHDNKEGNCEKHGRFFQPFCVGDPPEIICFLSDSPIQSDKLSMCSLKLTWSEDKIVSETRSGFAFIPNLERWPNELVYKVKYDVSVYPNQDPQYHLSNYTYILIRETRPKSSIYLHDLLNGLRSQKNIWVLNNNIMRTSNQCISASGELLLMSQNPNLLRKIRQRSQVQSQSDEVVSLSNRCEVTFDFDFRSMVADQTMILSSISEAQNRRNKRRRLYPSISGFIAEGDSPESKGDPLYTLPNGSTSDSSADTNVEDLTSDPKHQRNFCFENDVTIAEKGNPKEKRLVKKILNVSKAPKTHEVSSNKMEQMVLKEELSISMLTSSKDDSLVDKESDAKKEAELDTSQNSFRTSYIVLPESEYRCPILRASSSWFLLKNEVSRSKKLYELFRHKRSVTTVREACELLCTGKYEFIRTSLKEQRMGTIGFDPIQKSWSGEFTSLNLHVDIDSIDVITCPLGGASFNFSQASIFLKWNGNYERDSDVQIRNNGFIRFHNAYSDSYPGNYFGFNIVAGGGFRGYEVAEKLLNQPIQVEVGSVNLSWSLPLKLYAIVPSGSLMFLLKGKGALLELFDALAYGYDVRGSNISARMKLNQMLWYLITSSCLFFSSIAYKDGCSPGVWCRDVCCALSAVDSRRDGKHDTRFGHLSDFNSVQHLSLGSITIGLCMFARHQRALEQHSEVPQNLRCSELENVENYRLSEELLQVVNPHVKAVLESDIGSETCLLWFQSFWESSRSSIGNFVKLESDSERKRNKAFPSDESCADAFQRKYLCVEDMLPLNSIIFRGTVHGLKQTSCSESSFVELSRQLHQSFKPKCFVDGLIDVAYVFHSPTGSDISLYLRKKAVEDNCNHSQHNLAPLGSEKKLKDMGAYFSGSPGYPSFIGVSSRKGLCGIADSGITYSGIRKVKAYHTKWKGDSFRGRTFYDTPAAKQIEKIFSNYQALYGMALRARREGYAVFENTVANLRDSQEQVNHNIVHRSGLLHSFQNTNGVRLEYTCFFDSDFHCLKEPMDLIRMQEERMAMDDERLRSILLDIPDYFPWWMTIKHQNHMQECYPLALVCGRELQKFSLLLEAKALNAGMEIFLSGMELLSKSKERIESNRFSASFGVLEKLLRKLPTASAAKLISIVSKALFQLAYRQVNNMLCHAQTGTPCTPDPWMAVTGISAQWWDTGYPAVLLSRICRFPEFNVVFEMISGHETISLSSKEIKVMSCNDDKTIPASLTYRNIANHKAVRRLKLHGDVSDDYNDVNTDSLAIFVSRLLEPVMASCSEESLAASDRGMLLSTFVVRMLLSDVGFTLQSLSADKNISQTLWFKEKYGEEYDLAELIRLATLAEENEMWPIEHRVDQLPSCISLNVSMGIGCIEKLISTFKLRCIVKIAERRVSNQNQFLNISEEGYFPDRDFIAILIKEARRGEERGRSTERKWHSVLAVESIIDVFQHSEKSSYLPNFLKILSRCISKCMWASGYGNISPLFRVKPTGFRKDARSLWGPELIFARMRFTYKEEELGVAQSLSSGRGGENGLENVQEKIKEFETELSRLSELQAGLQLNSMQWRSAIENYNDISEVFWSLPDIEEKIMDLLEHEFHHVQERENLTRPDFHWIKVLVEKLIQIRKNVGDEGLCCILREGEIVAYRNRSEIEKDGVALQYPWSNLYPTPEVIYKKKTRVKRAGKIFSSSFPLLFKTKTRKEIGKSETMRFFEDCQFYNVEDVYRYLRADFDQGLSARMSHWRLAPTRVIASLLVRRT